MMFPPYLTRSFAANLTKIFGRKAQSAPKNLSPAVLSVIDACGATRNDNEALRDILERPSKGTGEG